MFLSKHFKLALMLTTSLFWLKAATAQQAYLFDGINDYARVEHSPPLFFKTLPITTEVQLQNIVDVGNEQVLVSKCNSTEGFKFGVDPDGFLFLDVGATRHLANNVSIFDNQCHHLAFTRSVKGAVYIYLDGVQVYKGTDTETIYTTEPLYFGTNNIDQTNFFTGAIDEIRLWSTVRTGAQILSNQTTCFTGSELGLVALWTMDDTSVGIMPDLASKKHHARLGDFWAADAADPTQKESSCIAACCDVSASFISSISTPLATEFVDFISNSQGANAHTWYVDGIQVGTNSSFTEAFGLGTHVVQLVVEGTKCRSTFAQVLQIEDSPLMCARDLPQVNISTCATIEVPELANGVVLFDDLGNCFTPESIKLPYETKSYTATSPGIYTCGRFKVYFRDVIANYQINGAGYGYNDATNGAGRRNVTCRVFHDLSQLFAPPVGVTTPDLVRIEIRTSDNGNFQYMSPGALGVGGSYFLEDGNVPSLIYGAAAKTLISGHDIYGGLPSMYSNLPHAHIRINFHYQFDTLLTPGVQSGYSKLYTVILHELLHGMGFASAIDLAAGNSKFAAYGVPNGYNLFDSYLKQASVPLLNIVRNPTTQLITSITPNAITLATCPNSAVEFNGTHNPTEQVYLSYGGAQPGSDLSHFNCSIDTTYVMNAAASAALSLNEEEVKTLCDLGYNTTGIFGLNNAYGNTLRSYNYSCTQTCQIIANHDTASLCRSGFSCATPHQLTISNAAFLGNDYGNPTGYIDLRVVVGGGSISTNASGFTYTPDPTFGGWAILSYTPTINCNGGAVVNGTPGYIFINVEYPPDPVSPVYQVNDCNLVFNGTFDNYNWYRVYNRISTLTNFGISNLLGVVYTNAAVGDNICGFNGNPYVALGFYPMGASANANGIHLELNRPINPGEEVTITMKASASLNSFAGANWRPTLNIYGSENPPCPLTNLGGAYQPSSTNCGVASAACPAYVPYCIVNQAIINNVQSQTSILCPVGSNNPNFQTYSFTYTHPSSASSAINHLVLVKGENTATQPSLQHSGTVMLDDVEVYKRMDLDVPMTIASQITNPTPCVGEQTVIEYTIIVDNAAGTLRPDQTITLSHNLFGSSNFAYATSNSDFDATGTFQISSNYFLTNDTLRLTLALNAINSYAVRDSILLNIVSGDMCFTSVTAAQALNYLQIGTPSNVALSAAISANTQSVSQGGTIAFSIEVCNLLNRAIDSIKLEVPSVAGLAFTFAPVTLNLAATQCTTIVINATATQSCMTPKLCAIIKSAATVCALPDTACSSMITVVGGAFAYPAKIEGVSSNTIVIQSSIKQNTAGDIYIAGIYFDSLNIFSGGVLIGGVPYTSTGGNFSAFVLKLDECGVSWVQEIPNVGFNTLTAVPILDIDTISNSVYVGFSYYSPCTIGSVVYTPNGAADIALVRLSDSTGAIEYTHIISGSEVDYLSDMVVHDSRILIHGTAAGSTGSLTIAGTSINYLDYTTLCPANPTNGMNDWIGNIFTAAFTDNGSSWSSDWCHTPASLGIASHLSLNKTNGDLYATGVTSASMQFPTGTSINTAHSVASPACSNADMYILKYNIGTGSSYSQIWGRTFGSNGFDWGNGEGGRPTCDAKITNNGSHLYALMPSSAMVPTQSPTTLSFQQEFGHHLALLDPATGAVLQSKNLATPTAVTNINNIPISYGVQTVWCNLALNNAGEPYVAGDYLLTETGVTGAQPSITFYNSSNTICSNGSSTTKKTGYFVAKYNFVGTTPAIDWVELNCSFSPTNPTDWHNKNIILDFDAVTQNSQNYCLIPINMNGSSSTPLLLGGANNDEYDSFLLRLLDNGSSSTYARPITPSSQQINELQTDLSMETEQFTIVLYPNPTKGHVTLEVVTTKFSAIERIEVLDIAGKVQLAIQQPTHEQQYRLDMMEQPAGIYVVRVLIDGRVINKRIVLID